MTQPTPLGLAVRDANGALQYRGVTPALDANGNTIILGGLVVMKEVVSDPDLLTAMGTDAAGVTPPTGATGVRGWLSAIWTKLSGTLAVADAAAEASLTAINTAVGNNGTTLTTIANGTTANGTTLTAIHASQPVLNGDGGSLAHVTNFPATQTIAGTVALSGTSAVQDATAEAALAALNTTVATLATSANQSAANTSLSTIAAAQGASTTGVAQPAGGAGILGWLSGIYKAITGTLIVNIGSSTTLGSGTIAVGGTAQQLFGGTMPTNGWKVANPHPTEDLWVNDEAGPASPFTCIRVFANGGQYATEPGEKPAAALSIYGATSGHAFIAKRW